MAARDATPSQVARNALAVALARILHFPPTPRTVGA
jgi:hypothetical protein